MLASEREAIYLRDLYSETKNIWLRNCTKCKGSVKRQFICRKDDPKNLINCSIFWLFSAAFMIFLIGFWALAIVCLREGKKSKAGLTYKLHDE